MKKFNSTLVCKDQGFTLLEILIAITLLAIVGIGVVGVTQNAFDTKERTTENNKNNLQIETAMSRFEWDFSQLYSPLFFATPFKATVQTPPPNSSATNPNSSAPEVEGTAPNTQPNVQVDPHLQEYYQRIQTRFERNEHFITITQEGMPIPRFYSPEKNVFEFFTSSNRRKMENTKQSHFAWVRYALANAEPSGEESNPNIPKSLKNLVRYFSADNPYHDKRLDIENNQLKGAVLLKNVESLEFQFWDFARRKWDPNIRTIPNGESLLRGVKILITWYDSAGIKRSTERIFRNHWPHFIPEDISQAPTTNTNGGTNGGTTGATGDEVDEEN